MKKNLVEGLQVLHHTTSSRAALVRQRNVPLHAKNHIPEQNDNLETPIATASSSDGTVHDLYSILAHQDTCSSMQKTIPTTLLCFSATNGEYNVNLGKLQQTNKALHSVMSRLSRASDKDE